jgi:hypothetical protein
MTKSKGWHTQQRYINIIVESELIEECVKDEGDADGINRTGN